MDEYKTKGKLEDVANQLVIRGRRRSSPATRSSNEHRLNRAIAQQAPGYLEDAPLVNAMEGIRPRGKINNVANQLVMLARRRSCPATRSSNEHRLNRALVLELGR